MTDNDHIDSPKPTWDELDRQRRISQTRSFLGQHLALALSTAAMVIFVIKVLQIAHRNPTTAVTIVQHAGILEVLLGLVITIVPWLGVILSVAMTNFMTDSKKLETPDRIRGWAFFGFMLFVFSFFISWQLFLIILAWPAFNVAAFFWRKSQPRKEAHDRQGNTPWTEYDTNDIVLVALQNEYRTLVESAETISGRIVDLETRQSNEGRRATIEAEWFARYREIRPTQSVDAMVVSLVLFAAMGQMVHIFSDDPWLQAERLEIDGGHDQVGYAIGTQDRWLVLLSEEERTVSLIEMSEITERTVCEVEPVRVAKTIYDHLGRRQFEPGSYTEC